MNENKEIISKPEDAKIGDRVKFITLGGWKNSGVIVDISEDSCLIKVDKIGNDMLLFTLPYFARILFEDNNLERDRENNNEM